jgi:hypothetical protein
MHVRPRFAAAIAFAVSLALSPALAGPQISIKTKIAEITVEVDKALKGHPDLTENLLAEGRKWAAQTRADAEKEKREPVLLWGRPQVVART